MPLPSSTNALTAQSVGITAPRRLRQVLESPAMNTTSRWAMAQAISGGKR